MNSYIFLDVDGVINPMNNYIRCHENGIRTIPSYIEFDPICMDNLKRLVSETKAKIVISSTWRIGSSMSDFSPEFRNLYIQLKKNNIIISDVTPVTRDGNRGQEIELWLNDEIKRQQYTKVPPYIILDDDSYDLKQHGDHLILIDGKIGIGEEETDRAIDRLNYFIKDGG